MSEKARTICETSKINCSDLEVIRLLEILGAAETRQLALIEADPIGDHWQGFVNIVSEEIGYARVKSEALQLVQYLLGIELITLKYADQKAYADKLDEEISKIPMLNFSDPVKKILKSELTLRKMEPIKKHSHFSKVMFYQQVSGFYSLLSIFFKVLQFKSFAASLKQRSERFEKKAKSIQETDKKATLFQAKQPAYSVLGRVLKHTVFGSLSNHAVVKQSVVIANKALNAGKNLLRVKAVDVPTKQPLTTDLLETYRSEIGSAVRAPFRISKIVEFLKMLERNTLTPQEDEKMHGGTIRFSDSQQINMRHNLSAIFHSMTDQQILEIRQSFAKSSFHAIYCYFDSLFAGNQFDDRFSDNYDLLKLQYKKLPELERILYIPSQMYKSWMMQFFDAYQSVLLARGFPVLVMPCDMKQQRVDYTDLSDADRKNVDQGFDTMLPHIVNQLANPPVKREKAKISELMPSLDTGMAFA